jgi:signal transduction histidine kinase
VSSGVYRDTLLRGLSSTALLLFGILLSLTVGAAAPGQAPRLAALATAALLWRGLFAAGSLGAALAGFASALDLAVGLGLALVALGLTGGLGSELYPLLLVDLALAHGFLGPAASRFLAVATMLGLGALTVAGPPDSAGAWLGVGLRLLWPLALLVAMEPWSRAANGDAGEPAAAPAAPLSMSPPGTPRAEANLQEILHDLRSPLTVIRLYAELLAEHARKGEPPVADHVQNLRAEIELMESLLDVDGESRAAVRSRRRRRERFDLVKLLGTLANTYRFAHTARLRIEFIAETPELPIVADSLAVQRAFRNVLDNAVKYTPAGGQVRIRARRVGTQAFVVITDTGVGMNRGEQQRAFEFWFRGHAARVSGTAGSGLGLGLTRGLLEPQGGRITLASEPGLGSEVTIHLPMAREGRS